jgi:competence protein ComEA
MGVNSEWLENKIWNDETEQQIVTMDSHDDVILRNGQHFSWLRGAPWVATVIGFVAGVFLVGVSWWLAPSNSHGDTGNRVADVAADGNVSATDANGVNADSTSASETIMVDVKGDVRHPGVYTLPVNARARDAIRAAGGYVHPEDAAGVNEAMPLDDGMEFFVPNFQSASVGSSLREDGSAPSDATAKGSVSDVRSANESFSSGLSAANQPKSTVRTEIAPSVTNKIDLNTATESTLETVPGIGPKRAQAILSYRAQHGGFTSVSQLRQVRGIGPTLYRRISAYVSVNPVKNGQKP